MGKIISKDIGELNRLKTELLLKTIQAKILGESEWF